MHDIEHLAQLFETRYALVISVARRYAPIPDLAYDIVQQTFLHFIQAVEKYQWDLNRDIGPLLYEITKNTALALKKDEQRRASTALRYFEEKLIQPLDKNDISSEEEYRTRRIKALRHCIEQLAPKSRDYVSRHYVDGDSMEEIARKENSSANTIRQTYCRIRAKLRECIKKQELPDP